MPTFRYQAEDREGRKASGQIVAPSLQRAIAELSAAGQRVTEMVELSAPADPLVQGGIVQSKIAETELVPRDERLSLAESVDLTALVSNLAASDLPLDAGLKAAALETPSRRLGKALSAVSARLAAGASLDEAIASEGRRFPPHVRCVVLAGLRSGRLAQVLEEFIELERRAAGLRRQVALTLAYPGILISLLFAVFAYFALAVFPTLTELFDDFQMDLPSVTVSATDAFSRAGVYGLVGNAVVIFGAWFLIWLASGLPELRNMLKAFPLLGPIARWSSLSHFARLLALLLESRLVVGESLKMAGDGSHDAELASACRRAAIEVERGRPLAETLALDSAFPRSLGPIVAWGQQAAALPEALRTAAEMFEDRLQSHLRMLRTTVPALTFLVVLCGVIFLFAAVSLPLISLIEKLT